jgi:TolA-binding protein
MTRAHTPHARRFPRIGAAFAGSLLLGACASTAPVPTASLDAARLAISNAERGEAGQYAASELAEARTELRSADGDVTQMRMVDAERMANQSRTEAELALATAGQKKAQAVNDEMQQSAGILIQEMQRNTGASQ